MAAAILCVPGLGKTKQGKGCSRSEPHKQRNNLSDIRMLNRMCPGKCFLVTSIPHVVYENSPKIKHFILIHLFISKFYVLLLGFNKVFKALYCNNTLDVIQNYIQNNTKD